VKQNGGGLQRRHHTAAPGIIRHLRKLLAKIVGIKCASVFIGQLTVSGEA